MRIPVAVNFTLCTLKYPDCISGQKKNTAKPAIQGRQKKRPFISLRISRPRRKRRRFFISSPLLHSAGICKKQIHLFLSCCRYRQRSASIFFRSVTISPSTTGMTYFRIVLFG